MPMQPIRSSLSDAQRLFSLRIASLDYYLAPPIPGVDITFSSLEGTVVDTVPIVRVFGSTPAGQRVCLHLHQAFPYFYVPYGSDLPSEPTEVAAYLRRLAMAINTALNMSGGLAATAAAASAAVGRGPAGDADSAAAGAGDRQQQQQGRFARVKKQHVADLLLVKARPIYGYYAEEMLFIKVVLYNPQDISRASLLLGSGAILGRRFQPYEAHIPFLLQLKIDFNLVGMGWLKLQRAVFRDPAAPPASQHDPAITDAQQQHPAAAAARAAGFAVPPPCPAANSRYCWDPWKADSAANVQYNTEPWPQPLQRNPNGIMSGPSPSPQGSGQQGSAGVPGGSADSSSQGLAGSECVWDEPRNVHDIY